MPEIVFLFEFPHAAKFCSDYIEKHWEYDRQNAIESVNSCLQDNNGLPFILVAKEGESILGTIMAAADNADVSEKYSPWLALLYVEEPFRNRGIGTQLVETACKNLKNLGYSKVYIDTTNAQGFYKKLGWKFLESVNWLDKEITSIFTIDL